MKIAIHLDAGHTTNGNPRRVYVVLDEKAQIVDVIDEGYEGSARVTRVHGKIPISEEIETTPGQYRDMKKFYPSRLRRSGR